MRRRRLVPFDALESVNLAYGLGVLDGLRVGERPPDDWRIRIGKQPFRDQYGRGLAEGRTLRLGRSTEGDAP